MNTYFDDISSFVKRPLFIFFCLIVISLGLCGIYVVEGQDGPIHSLQKSCNYIVQPLSMAGNSTSVAMSSLMDYLDDQSVDEDSITDLQKENAKLKQQLIISESYKQQAQRLQKLLNLKDKYNSEGVCTYVIGRSSSAWNQTLTLDCGSEGGIEAGQSVFSEGGLIGQISSVTPTSSVVRLLSDPNSGVSVRIGQDNSDCILRGSLEGVLYIDDFDINKQANVGDAVVTSGLGGSYVEGITVGSVYQVIENAAGEGKRIAVNPAADLHSIKEVFVLSK